MEPLNVTNNYREENRQPTEADRFGTEASVMMHRWPAITAGVFAGLGLLAASVLGVGEAAIAGGAGYLAYRWLRGGNRTASSCPSTRTPSNRRRS
jgi:hypothetical protein